MPRKSKIKKSKPSSITTWWLDFEYRRTTTAVFLILLFIVILDSAIVQAGLSEIHSIGFFGVLIGGAFYTSLFTTAPGIAILTSFTDIYSPVEIALVGAIGSVIGDLIILYFFEDKLSYELKPLVKKFRLKKIMKNLRRKKERKRMIPLGMFAVASPLPDEIGIALLGLSHLSVVRLLQILYILKFA
jgi:hypothetical protein